MLYDYIYSFAIYILEIKVVPLCLQLHTMGCHKAIVMHFHEYNIIYNME